METNRIYLEDCLETMKRMGDNVVSLTVTSPPYDDLRTYNNKVKGLSIRIVFISSMDDLDKISSDRIDVLYTISILSLGTERLAIA